MRSFKVVSLGKLDEILKASHWKYDYVFIDEAHRFRNEITQGYEQLHQICHGKKVILVSATPLNNKIDDIFSQLKLFQIPKRSTIPGILDLEQFFQSLKSKINKYSKDDPRYMLAVKQASKEVREKILKYVMVRRTRSSIQKYFAEDMAQQGLFFPEIEDPQRLVYEFDQATDNIFNQTIQLIKRMTYSRYTPLLYLKTPLPEFEKQSQRNLGAFMKSVLVKRLESSFHAFRNTLARFVASYEKFIAMYRSGTVYISREINVFALLENDDELRLLELADQQRVEKYDAGLFRDEFIALLENDLQALKQMQDLWNQVETDPKLTEFMAQLKKNKLLKGKKVIVFTESKETGEYLLHHLDQKYPGKIFFYSSSGGLRHSGDSCSGANQAKDIIRANFDPSHESPANEVQILITTDVLAEGVNLHRSNIIINYDLPWNPTRVLQRAGRINRVGTAHSRIYIFNFFPTAQADKELGLEDNIKAKIQAFHDALGEDARYLTDEEVVTTHDILGAELYKRLNDKNLLQGEDEDERTELEQLQLLRKLRDEDPALFERIKKLPRKARTGRAWNGTQFDRLITFFRKGNLKRIYITNGDESSEINFFEAADILACEPQTSRLPIPRHYYELLDYNKDAFEQANSGEPTGRSRGGGRSNEKYLLQILKSNNILYYAGYTDEDEEFLRAVRRALEEGVIARNTAKRIKQQLDKEKDANPLKILAIMRKNIPASLLEEKPDTAAQKGSNKKEVILSEYLQGGHKHEI
nr:helicase-related protein [Syntrophomonas palmitatica]